MESLKREGSLVTIRDKNGKLWLTKRKKIRRTKRRQAPAAGWAVRHIPIKRIMEKGDWLFTCSMKPLKFGHWIEKQGEYPELKKKLSKEEYEEFIKRDDFVTLNGSHHSKSSCSLSPISDEYAKFFLRHQLWNLFEVNGSDFDKYEEAVKKVCEIFNIKYEGI